jgi:hypothetical protein
MLPLNLSNLRSLLVQSRKLLLGPFHSLTRLRGSASLDQRLAASTTSLSQATFCSWRNQDFLWLCAFNDCEKKKGLEAKSVRWELCSATVSYLERHEGALQGGR